MPSARHPAKTYLDDAEAARLKELAARTHLSQAEVLRRLLMAQPLPAADSLAGWDAIRDLMRVNADQARLGNLFKLALDEAPDDTLQAQLQAIATDIATCQAALKAAAVALRRRFPDRPMLVVDDADAGETRAATIARTIGAQVLSLPAPDGRPRRQALTQAGLPPRTRAAARPRTAAPSPSNGPR